MKKSTNDNTVFISGVAISALIVFWGLVFPQNFEFTANKIFEFLGTNFGWFYVLMMSSFIIFCVWIGFFSKYKDIKLGKDDDVPEYSNISWFAMLFSAGMGIGLVFWGIAEPANHFINPAHGIESASGAAALFAMEKSFLHWGMHPWANYCVLGMGLAYMQYRRNKPLLVSSVFIPLLGEERSRGVIGKIIDVLAIFATIAGMATSLGLGTYQINSGLNYIFGIPETPLVQIIIVCILTVIFTGTAISGVDKGIKMISNLNMVFVAVLLIGAFIGGPTVKILNVMVQSTGQYFYKLIQNSFDIGVFDESNWHSAWTLFYWAWWIAWAPFTGVFIARISKGRTIKEFVSGVLMVPALISFIWFAVFGGISLSTPKDILQEAIKSTSTAFYVVMNNITFGTILSVVAIVLLFTFFITSANSATFVLGMLSEEGNIEPSNSKKAIWGVLQSGLALALMIGSQNGLQMLQTISIAAALPFSVIMACAMYSLVVALKNDPYIQ